MYESAFERLLANCRDIRKTRDDRVHHSVALIGIQRMTWHAARFIHDDHARIFMYNFEREIPIGFDYGAPIRRSNFDAILGADDLTLLRPPPVDPHQPALDHLLRHAPRRRKPSPHEIMIEPFFY